MSYISETLRTSCFLLVGRNHHTLKLASPSWRIMSSFSTSFNPFLDISSICKFWKICQIYGKPWKLPSRTMWLKKEPATSTWWRGKGISGRMLPYVSLWIPEWYPQLATSCSICLCTRHGVVSLKSSFHVTCATFLAAYKARFRARNLRNFLWRPALLPHSWQPLQRRRCERLARTSLRSHFRVLRNRAFPSLVGTMGAHGYIRMYTVYLWKLWNEYV